MSITSLGAVLPARVSAATPARIPPVQPVQAPAPLAPAVQVDIRGQDQEVDPNSGDVVVQLPDPVVLKARAYAEAAEARAKPTSRPLDRSA